MTKTSKLLRLLLFFGMAIIRLNEIQCRITDFKACKLDLFRKGNLRGDPVHTLTNESIGDNLKHRIKRGSKIKSVSNGKGTWAVYCRRKFKTRLEPFEDLKSKVSLMEREPGLFIAEESLRHV